MRNSRKKHGEALKILLTFLVMVPGLAYSQESAESSYSPVVIKEQFADVVKLIKVRIQSR